MKPFRLISLIIIALAGFSLSCKTLSGLPSTTTTPTPANTATPLPPIPVQPGQDNPEEPVFITGEIPYTSPFLLDTLSEAFVLLEDQAGFFRRDRDFTFSLESQAIGPLTLHEDKTLTYSLALPAIPQGTMLDLDNNGLPNPGVQVFAVAYWSNTWGGPFLEKRDGNGWSNAYASTRTDPEREDEIIGGILVVWSPDDRQAFPSGFGVDEALFTEDDPVAPIPAGYNLVDLNQEPFRFSKQARPEITLFEGEVAVNDFSDLGYLDAFEALLNDVSLEYPFTSEKQLDWESLSERFTPLVSQVKNDQQYYRVLRDFTQAIPDAHVSLSISPEVFFEDYGGGFGLILAELSDGRVIVTDVLSGMPADEAGIQPGAEIISWDGRPVSAAISTTSSAFGPYSTPHAQRQGQVVFLTRVPPNTRVIVKYRNPSDTRDQEVTLRAQVEYDSLFNALRPLSLDEVTLPVQAEVLDGSGLGYIQISTFSEDNSLMAELWDYYLQGFLDNEVPGLIIDLRSNGGGSAGLAYAFAGYFFDREITLYTGYYYNKLTGKFEPNSSAARIEPAPLLYDAPIAVLVSPDCISACEGFAYALSQDDRSIIVGHIPSAGAFGEVSRGQYKLPGDVTLQFPTGRPETPGGQVLIEGEGIALDIRVPVTAESALHQVDAVLEAAIQALSEIPKP